MTSNLNCAYVGSYLIYPNQACTYIGRNNIDMLIAQDTSDFGHLATPCIFGHNGMHFHLQ